MRREPEIQGGLRAHATGRGDRGFATAELAVALPSLMLLCGLALGAVDATLDKLRCVDAAREAALVQSRGGDGAAAGRAAAPSGAVVNVIDDRGVVRVDVTVRTAPLGTHLPGVEVEGSATAALEPGVAP